MARRRARVEFTEGAERDLDAIRDQIARHRPATAARWVRALKQKVDLLRSMPLGFEIIPEAEQTGLQCRHILHGDYRIISQVFGNRVSIIHGARIVTAALPGLEPPLE